MSFRLSADPIPANLLEPDDRSGARVVFEGRVRNHNEGKAVRSLEYEAFDELAVKEGSEIVVEALARFPIRDAECTHRTGHLGIGDAAIRVEVTSDHRGVAFEACRWIVDEVKSRVPIWKREHYDDGVAAWIDPRARD